MGHSPGRGGKPNSDRLDKTAVATDYHAQTPSSLTSSSVFESDHDTAFVAASHPKQHQPSQPSSTLQQEPQVPKTDSMLLDEIFQQVGLETSIDPFINSDDD